MNQILALNNPLGVDILLTKPKVSFRQGKYITKAK